MQRRSIVRTLAALVAAIGLMFAAPASAAVLNKGVITPKVVTPDGATSYALYLPSTYDPGRPWPLVIILDPRGNAVPAADVFRAGAERYGYILVSSYQSRSDTGTEINFPTLKALLRDSGDRLNINLKRVYLAGFSGTARFAISVARQSPRGLFAGILAAGASYSPEIKPRQGDDFPIYATVGEEDFNWPEMHHFERSAAAAGLTTFLDTHGGPHDWPPPALASDALGWFDILAMRRQTTAPDPQRVARIWAAFASRASAEEATGNLIPARRIWAMLARDFAGLHETAAAQAKAMALAVDPRLRAAEKARDRLIAENDDAAGNSWQGFNMTSAEAAAQFFDLDHLNRVESSDPDPHRRASAARTLNYLAGQAGFYRVQQTIADHDWKRTVMLLSIAIRARPDSAAFYVSRAKYEMRSGDRRRALDDLRQAASLGFANAALVEQLADFATLRSDPSFVQAIAAMKAAAAH